MVEVLALRTIRLANAWTLDDRLSRLAQRTVYGFQHASAIRIVYVAIIVIVHHYTRVCHGQGSAAAAIAVPNYHLYLVKAPHGGTKVWNVLSAFKWKILIKCLVRASK